MYLRRCIIQWIFIWVHSIYVYILYMKKTEICSDPLRHQWGRWLQPHLQVVQTQRFGQQKTQADQMDRPQRPCAVDNLWACHLAKKVKGRRMGTSPVLLASGRDMAPIWFKHHPCFRRCHVYIRESIQYWKLFQLRRFPLATLKKSPAGTIKTWNNWTSSVMMAHWSIPILRNLIKRKNRDSKQEEKRLPPESAANVFDSISEWLDRFHVHVSQVGYYSLSRPEPKVHRETLEAEGRQTFPLKEERKQSGQSLDIAANSRCSCRWRRIGNINSYKFHFPHIWDHLVSTPLGVWSWYDL